MALELILWGCALAAASGLPGACLPRRRALGQRLAAAIGGLGCAAGLAGAAIALAGGGAAEVAMAWPLPGGELRAGCDALSAFFLVPVFVLGALGPLAGLAHWNADRHPRNARRLHLCHGLLVASMAAVIVSRQSVLFMIAWEVMALAAFLLVTTGDHDRAVRRSGLVFLAASHAGALCLLAAFALLRAAGGSFDLGAGDAARASEGAATAIFLLAAAGFGLKAGLMPLHVWLPGAYSSAPCHVSAVLSGATASVGLYGIVRVTGLLPGAQPAWGWLLLGLGAASAVLGAAFALAQHDLRRLLAYSSVENAGIMMTGLGLAVAGRSAGRSDWVVLGLGGCLLGAWNHALFKPLLFFGAGAVAHATGTTRIDRLGGLARRMPRTGLLFLVGAAAISALPPLNGFAGELLTVMGLFHLVVPAPGSAPGSAAAALAAPALAMAAALGAAAFVKACGAVFLGQPRSDAAAIATEGRALSLAPMALLAACCIAIGAAPGLVAPALDRAVACWAPADGAAHAPVTALVPLPLAGLLGACAAAAAAVILAPLARGLRGAARAVTWDCGYAAPTPRMQYTGSSLAQMLVALFAWALRPATRVPRVSGAFPEPARFESRVDDAVLEGAVVPLARRGSRALARLRVIQHGRIQWYVLYIALVLIGLLVWDWVETGG
jgi:formate hydrogenlyase subunit 3/multisubunit Na+/H+ antiporter MnhD subunit